MKAAAILFPFLVTACAGLAPSDTGGGSGDDVTDPNNSLPKPLAPGKVAIILAHGLGGTADSFDPTIVEAIEAHGHAVLRTEVPGVEGVKARAIALAPQIDKFLADTGATKVHIIGHSMGGLDARYAISKLGYASKVASLTTMSTPHHGSPLADLALGLEQSSMMSQTQALDAIIELVGRVDPEALQRALEDLAVANAPAFNAAVKDDANVKYFSYAGFSTVNQISNPNAAAACQTAAPMPGSTRALLVLAQPVVANGTDRIPNDAVVSIPSATWGTFAGCVSSDHIGETGAKTDVYDSPALFEAIAEKLASL